MKTYKDKHLLLKELLKASLEYLPSTEVISSSDTCEQCGNYNQYTKFKIINNE